MIIYYVRGAGVFFGNREFLLAPSPAPSAPDIFVGPLPFLYYSLPFSTFLPIISVVFPFRCLHHRKFLLPPPPNTPAPSHSKLPFPKRTTQNSTEKLVDYCILGAGIATACNPAAFNDASLAV